MSLWYASEDDADDHRKVTLQGSVAVLTLARLRYVQEQIWGIRTNL